MMRRETNKNLDQSSLKDSKTKPTFRMRWRKFNSSWKITAIPLLILILIVGYRFLGTGFLGYTFLGYGSLGTSAGILYEWIYILFIIPISSVGLVYVFIKNMKFLFDNSEQEIESSTKRFFFHLYVGSFILAVVVLLPNIFMAFSRHGLIKTSIEKLYFIYIILMAVSGFLFAKSNFELKILKNKILSLGLVITVVIGPFAGFIAYENYPTTTNTDTSAQTVAIQTYLKDQHIAGDMKISSINDYDENNIGVDYTITQEQTVIKASANLKRKPKIHVVENSLTNYDKDAYKLSLGIMESREANQIQTKARSEVKQAIKKNTFSHKLELQSEDQMAEGIRFLKGDENPALKKLAQANLASDNPNLRTFGGYPNIKFTDAFAAHAFVIYIGLKGKITEADLQKLLGSLDCSKLADGYYKLNVQLDDKKSKDSFEIRNHQIVKRLYLEYSNYVGGVEDQTRIDQLYF